MMGDQRPMVDTRFPAVQQLWCGDVVETKASRKEALPMMTCEAWIPRCPSGFGSALLDLPWGQRDAELQGMTGECAHFRPTLPRPAY